MASSPALNGQLTSEGEVAGTERNMIIAHPKQ
jgi:hypothetical protein